MSQQTHRPAAITVDRSQRILTVSWSDGHESRYSFAGLRAICPCVECRGGHHHMGQPPDPRQVRDAVDAELELRDAQQVGAYALQFQWSDGHATGIYTWGHLRAACPCPICLPAEG
ncbi:MAG: gamma-butyrobetaine hydroxylase-like domain-containing protein [Candidatus Promineifilaceae bacterium]